MLKNEKPNKYAIGKENCAAVVILFHPDMSIISNVLSYFSFFDKVFLWQNSDIDSSVVYELDCLCGDKIVWCGDCSNRGLGYALNRALEMSYNAGYQWLLTMDQDSSFRVGCFEKLIMFADTIYADYTQCNTALFSANHLINGVTEHDDISVDSWVMMSGNLINIAWSIGIGGFNDDLFIDGVDIDFCQRLLADGFTIKVCKDALLNHNLGNIENITFLGFETKTTNHNGTRLYYIFRNYIFIISTSKLNCKLKRRLLKFLLHKLVCVIMFESGKLNKLCMILKGVLHYVIGRQGKLL